MIKKNICVVGAGNWGKNHIKTLHELSSLGGIVERDESLRSSFKKKYPYLNTYSNLDQALGANYDGFIVATPAETHYSIAKSIILHKKCLLVEKPITLSVEHAESLVRLAKENDVSLMVGHVLLFHPAIIKIKQIIDSGRIGQLQYIYSNRLNLGKVRTEENVFWSLAPHDISIFQTLDRQEIDFDFEKATHFRDAESGKDVYVDPAVAKSDYQKRLNEHLDSVRQICTKHGARYRLTPTDEPLEHVLFEFVTEQTL